MLGGWQHPAANEQVLPVVTAQWHQHRNRTAPIGDLEGLPTGNSSEIAAGMLTQFSDANPLHVLQSST